MQNFRSEPITFAGPDDSGITFRPIRVAVLVGLEWRPEAGGHVKFWEKLANAASGMAEAIDLTVHFLGAESSSATIADNVRFAIHRPAFSTARLPFLSHVPDHTDLAPHHPALARRLAVYDVVHTTDAFFSFAKTAARVTRSANIPLTNSIHTDTPRYARIYTAATLERIVGVPFARALMQRFPAHEWAERDARSDLAAHQRRCRFALVARSDEYQRACRVLPPSRVGFLRRGIDRESFSPEWRDRGWLERTYGIAPDRFVVLFVGRIDRGKNVLTLVAAVRTLIEQGHPVHLVCAGRGPDEAVVRDMLGPRVTLPGFVAGEDLSRLYASADAFGSPSEVEVCSNVIMEALASALPVLASEAGGMNRAFADGRSGVTVRGAGAAPWIAALDCLRADPALARTLGQAARDEAARSLPTWLDVLAEDLLPVWRRAAIEAARDRPPRDMAWTRECMASAS
jgi:glycosyltransferase involved in cell wall biosynthesis